MEVTMDVLMFLHLFVYPMLLGGGLVGFVLTAANCKTRGHFIMCVILFWVCLGLFLLSVETHINYQTYSC